MDCHVSSAAPPRKLTGSASIYDGVFSGTGVREGRVSFKAEDYAEVFAGGGGGENGCRRAAIPVLDLPCFQEGRLRVDVRRSSLDYLKIFGGGAAGGFVASYEEVVGRGKGTEVGVGRVNTKKPALPLASNNHFYECSVQETVVLSRNEPKIFNVSYSKSNVGSNGKSNGTVHVAQLADVPGYSVIVEENCLLKRENVNTEEVLNGNVVSDACGGMVKDVDCRSVPSDVYVKMPAEKVNGKDISWRRFSKEGSFYGEMLFDSSCGFTVGKDSYKEGPLCNFSSASFDKKREINGRLSPRSISEGIDHSYSPPGLESQLDANSAAAASVAALKIAIEKAQARIQVAKEIKEGKKVFDFEVRVKKKLDSGDVKGDKKKVKKEYQSSELLRQQNLDTRGYSVNEIPKPNLAEVELVSGEEGEELKKSISEESNAVMLGQTCDKNGVDCWKGEVENGEEEEEDLFEDAMAEPYHPVRDELGEVIGVKIVNDFDVLESNCDASPSMDSAVGVNAETALDEALCHEKANSQLLTSLGGKENKEQMVPFEQSEELTRDKGNAPDIFAVSDDIASVKKCAFHFHTMPFENIPELKISKSNVNCESQQMMEHNLELCANDEHDRKYGDNLSDEGTKEIREDLGMTLEKCENEEQSEQHSGIFTREMQTEEPCIVEENSLEHPAVSLEGKHENGAGESFYNAIPRERIDHLALENYGDFREAGEIEECPHCQEGKSGETVISDGSHTEDLKVWVETWDTTETVKVPAEIKTRRRLWTVEAQDVSRLINALAANADEPDVLEQLTGTPRGYEHSEDHTADEITDDVKREEDDDQILLENVSPKSRDSECFSAEVASDNIMEGEITNEPVESICSAFGDEQFNLGNDVTEAYNSTENTPHIEETFVDFQPTDDKASDRYDNNDSTEQGPSCEMEDAQVSESRVSDCSGPESEESVKEANIETCVELSDDDLCRFDEMVTEVNKLDGISTEKQETHPVEVGIDDAKDKEKHQAAQIAEATTVEGPDSEMQVKKSGRENEKAKEKEREMERQAVERAINEARQRAYAEAKQRAERAAVEKANLEARQRGIAKARENVGKSYSAEPSNKADDNRSVKAKIKAERAAVERATTEARERALEKALAEKRTAGDKASKPGKKSHDQQYRSTSSSGNSRHPSTSDPSAGRFEGNDGESAERRKARLERHQRTAERAAKALAEKNKRDLLAQREQAERNRLAETLDPEIKRWSSGKQGNLRALLSTLQYILGPDSGWQPVTLTEIVTNAAVRKAYKKATLYVHPDKLQQRGASLQQKYICEKVFDLLKDAWNKFSSDER